MGKYVIRRLLQMIPVIIGVTFIIYVSVYALGDPDGGQMRGAGLPARLHRQVPRRLQPRQAADRAVPALHGQPRAGRSGDQLLRQQGARRAGLPLAHHPQTGHDGARRRDGDRDHGRSAGRDPARKVHRQPGDREHTVSDLHSDLRHRQCRAACLRRAARVVPGHRDPGNHVPADHARLRARRRLRWHTSPG